MGSSIYSITAKGSLVSTGWDERGEYPKFDRYTFNVICSCPDGVRQQESNSRSIDKLYVCKHAKAVLDTVCDPEATKDLVDNKKVKIAEYNKHQAEQAKYLSVQRVKQDEQLPGERERIVYGLSKRSDEEIIGLIKRGIHTVSGIEALGKLFPVSVMPHKKTIQCGRCKKDTIPSTSQV